jgi:hypothetical protein
MGRAEARHYSERLDRADLRRLMDGMADLIIEVDDQGAVVDLSGSDIIGAAPWVGLAFTDVVSPDSLEKARDLLSIRGQSDGEGPWGTARHVNLIGAKGEGRPFLMRLFTLRGGGPAVRLLIGHDLAPESRMQRQFEAAQQVMIRDYETRLLRLQESYQRDLRASTIAEAAGRVGMSPLEQILAAFAKRLRRQCALEAIAKTGDDYRAAAAVLGISMPELDAILSEPLT